MGNSSTPWEGMNNGTAAAALDQPVLFARTQMYPYNQPKKERGRKNDTTAGCVETRREKEEEEGEEKGTIFCPIITGKVLFLLCCWYLTLGPVLRQYTCPICYAHR
jgi:hypothetical protein